MILNEPRSQDLSLLFWDHIFSWLFFRREKYAFLFQLDGFLWFLCIFQIFNLQKCIPKKFQSRIHSSHILKISEISTSKCIVVRYTCSHYDSLLGKSNWRGWNDLWSSQLSCLSPNYLCLFGKRRNCLWEKQIKNKIKEKRLQERWLGFFMANNITRHCLAWKTLQRGDGN